jgi:hypothetical protein
MNSSAGYIICVDSLCDGVIPLLTDGANAPIVFYSEHEAQREIADAAITRLQEFLAGERDFDDSTLITEFVQRVAVLPNGFLQIEQNDR